MGLTEETLMSVGGSEGVAGHKSLWSSVVGCELSRIEGSGIGCGSETRGIRVALRGSLGDEGFRNIGLWSDSNWGLSVVVVQEGELATADTLEEVLGVLEIALVTVPGVSLGFAGILLVVSSDGFVLTANFLLENSGTSGDLVRILLGFALEGVDFTLGHVESEFGLGLSEVLRAVVVEHQDMVSVINFRVSLIRHYLFSRKGASGLGEVKCDGLSIVRFLIRIRGSIDVRSK
jgi:hypothetical protein